MKLLPIVNLVILSLFSVSSSKGEEALDRRLEVLIHEAQFRAQREVIQFAARPMFNHVNDWQRWVNQVNAMPANQINGLMNLLNPHQRQFLLQRQRLISQSLRQQWILQQLWMQQNALANLPFGMMALGFNQPRIAYAQIVQWFPQGVQLNANAVVSPDRRHVRMNLNPIFSSIGPVYNYNIRNGAYYQAPSYQYPGGLGQTHHGRVQRATSNAHPSSTPRTRPLPDWYRKIRNNP